MHPRFFLAVLKIKSVEGEVVKAIQKVLQNSIIGGTCTELLTYQHTNPPVVLSTQICFLKNKSDFLDRFSRH